MKECDTIKKGTNTYVRTTCAYCEKEIWRQKHRVKTNKVYCTRPAYCYYADKLRSRDPIGESILKHKNEPNFLYFIGLICTDGNIRYHNKPKSGMSYNCEVNLHQQDSKTMIQIQQQFGGILRNIKDNTIRWVLSNKFFVEYLISIGITQNKSKTLDISNWFNTLKKDEKLHFLRGVIDGDGCIKQYKNNNRMFNICCGSKPFYNMLKKFLLTEFNNLNIKEQHYPTYSYLQLNGRYMLPILDEVYKNIEHTKLLYISRKYETYKTIKEHFTN